MAAFHFRASTHQLALNFGDHPHSIHGNAWQKPWQVGRSKDSALPAVVASSTAGDDAEAWPFAYRAEQTLRTLDPEGLAHHADRRESGRRAQCPAGSGPAPVLSQATRCSAAVRSRNVYRDRAGLASDGMHPVPAEWDYRRCAIWANPALDNCFERLGRQRRDPVRAGRDSACGLMPIRSSATSSSMCRRGVIFSPSNRSLI